MALSAELAVKKLARQAENCICPNCGTYSKYGFNTVCIKYLTFVCNLCKTAHQAVSHRCKSLTMSSWDQGEVLKLKKNGNEVARNTWLAAAPEPGMGGRPKEGDDVNVFKRFVVAVYEEKKYYQTNQDLNTFEKSGGGVHVCISNRLDSSVGHVVRGTGTSNPVSATSQKSLLASNNNVGNDVPTVDLLDLMPVSPNDARTGTSTSSFVSTNMQSSHFHCEDFGDFADFSSLQSKVQEQKSSQQEGYTDNNSKEEDWGDFADFSKVSSTFVTTKSSNARDVLVLDASQPSNPQEEDFGDFADFSLVDNSISNNNNNINNCSIFDSAAHGHTPLFVANPTKKVTDSYDWLSNDMMPDLASTNQGVVSNKNKFDPLFLEDSMQTEQNNKGSVSNRVQSTLPSINHGYGNTTIMNNGYLTAQTTKSTLANNHYPQQTSFAGHNFNIMQQRNSTISGNVGMRSTTSFRPSSDSSHDHDPFSGLSF
jgi:hypothetical protein